MPPSSGDLPHAKSGADSSGSIEEAPASSRRVATAAPQVPEPPASSREIRMALHVGDFLRSTQPKEGRAFVRSVVIRRLYGSKPKKDDVDDALVDDIVQMACERAASATQLPWFRRSLRAWMARLTRRTVADYFKAGKTDDKYLDRGADASRWTDGHAAQTDWGARAHLINKWLARQIGDDPKKIATLRLMWEHNVEKRSLEELAAENGTTVRALANRFYKLREELAPKIALMDRENAPVVLFFLALLLLVGVGALVLAWLLGAFRPTEPVVPATPPAPSATVAPAPPPPPAPFNNALPTDAGDKPERLKP